LKRISSEKKKRRRKLLLIYGCVFPPSQITARCLSQPRLKRTSVEATEPASPPAFVPRQRRWSRRSSRTGGARGGGGNEKTVSPFSRVL
jgi:hypothetical protein